jgi:hypothetical protein
MTYLKPLPITPCGKMLVFWLRFKKMSAEKLWLTNLMITKALAAALVKRGVISQEEILAEFIKPSASNDPLVESALQDAKEAINNLGK